MDSEKYLKDVLITLSADMEAIGKRLKNPSTVHLLHAVMGMSTESGELLDMVKKHVFYGKPLDWVNLEEELGDSNWYQSVAIHTAKMAGYVTSLEIICNKNIAKLKARYGGKFSEAAAQERDLDNERALLESELPKLDSGPKEGEILFNVADQVEPVLKLAGNGDIFVKGRLVENDIEVLQGFREFLLMSDEALTTANARGVFSKFSNKQRGELVEILQELGV